MNKPDFPLGRTTVGLNRVSNAEPISLTPLSSHGLTLPMPDGAKQHGPVHLLWDQNKIMTSIRQQSTKERLPDESSPILRHLDK